jgi:hypothetical protein
MAQAQAGQLWEKSFGAHTAQLLPVNRPSPTQSKLKSGFWCCSFAYNQSPESIKFHPSHHSQRLKSSSPRSKTTACPLTKQTRPAELSQNLGFCIIGCLETGIGVCDVQSIF